MASRAAFEAAGQRIRVLSYAGLGPVELRVVILRELAKVCPLASGQWLVLHASHLDAPGGSQIAIVIEPASRAELGPVIVAGYGLTAREAQTMTLMLRGLPAKQIAATLQVTTHTANDHIKAVYAKTGVGSRGELMATMFRNHYLPRG